MSNKLLQKNYLIKVALNLNDNDCFNLVNSKNICEYKKTGNFYCPIKNKIVLKKYCTKDYCENHYSIDEATADNI